MDYLTFILIALSITAVVTFGLLGTIIFLEVFKKSEYEENENDKKE